MSYRGNRDYAIGVARAFGGALIFSLPILMTMETWQLGFYMDRFRLALLLISMIPLLVGLAYYSGFEQSTRLHDAIIDAFVAIAVAFALASAILFVLGVLRFDMSPNEWIGKVALQSVTGSVGALLAQSQFGGEKSEDAERRESGAFSEYFYMAAGALFLCASVAPTEEVILIAYKISAWQGIAIMGVSLLLMHAFVYAVDFRGQHQRAEGMSVLSEFIRLTIVGYVIALGICAYMCWSFGRLDGVALSEALRIVVVLGFPASIGAAAARLVL